MSGLLALLDDVAAIAKVAAASIDDIGTAAAKAGSKAAALVVDDAAVTPKYVQGFRAERELPIIWRITKGSIVNKIVILMPLLLILEYFWPVAITPLLMLGGLYLCYEGAEKILHALAPHADPVVSADFADKDPTALEEEKVQGAIKTDFILSAEIMTLSLTVVEEPQLWMKVAVLTIVGLGITALVYGAVALIVKMDDAGVALARRARTGFGKNFGRGMVKAMPIVMKVLTIVGTAAMLWVGGNIVLHGLDTTGWWSWPYQTIHHLADAAAVAVGQAQGFVRWFVTALIDGICGLVIGLVLIPIASRVIIPLWSAVRGKKAEAH